jgi:hypothetical protein
MKDKTIAVNPMITARQQGVSNRVLLFYPSVESQSGEIYPATELYLSFEEIELLHREYCQPTDDTEGAG